MNCRLLADLSAESVDRVVEQFVESADGRGGLADLRKMLERGIAPGWAHPLGEAPKYIARIKAGSAYVVDDFGLPEAVAVFKALSEGGYLVTSLCFFNALGNTAFFKKHVGVTTLVELSGGVYAKYLGTPDRGIHALGRLRYTREEIAGVIKERVGYILGLLVRGGDGVAVISDHGYDVLKDGGGYYLAHGPYAFSRLAFLIVAHRV